MTQEGRSGHSDREEQTDCNWERRQRSFEFRWSYFGIDKGKRDKFSIPYKGREDDEGG